MPAYRRRPRNRPSGSLKATVRGSSPGGHQPSSGPAAGIGRRLPAGLKSRRVAGVISSATTPTVRARNSTAVTRLIGGGPHPDARERHNAPIQSTSPASAATQAASRPPRPPTGPPPPAHQPLGRHGQPGGGGRGRGRAMGGVLAPAGALAQQRQRPQGQERADQRADRGAAWGAAGEVKEPAAGAQATFTPTMAPMAAPAIIAAAAPQPIGRASRIGKEGCCMPNSLGRNPARHKRDDCGRSRSASGRSPAALGWRHR
jgi:hypothetical protein